MAGKLYVADTENHAIRLIDLNAKTVKTVAGTGQQAEFAASKGGISTDPKRTALSSPWDLTMLGNKLYIAMAGLHQLWVMDLAKNSIGPLAGSGRENIEDGPLLQASLAQPSGITNDSKKLYFADSEVSAVREAELTPDPGIETIVGEGLFEFGDRDGVGAEARLQHPLGIAYRNQKLFVADSYNHKIKIVDPIAKSATSFMGNGSAGLKDGVGAQFSEPGGLTFLGDDLFVADTNNNVIRKINLAQKSAATFKILGLTPPGLESKIAVGANVTASTTQATKIQAAKVGATKSAAGKSDAGKPAKPVDSSKLTSDPFLILPGAIEKVFSEQQVRPGSNLNLLVNAKLPPKFELNDQTSITYSIEQLSGKCLSFDDGKSWNGRKKGTVNPPAMPIKVKFSAREGKAKIRVIATIYYCAEGSNGVCMVHSLYLTIPVTVARGAKQTELHVDCDLPGR